MADSKGRTMFIPHGISNVADTARQIRAGVLGNGAGSGSHGTAGGFAGRVGVRRLLGLLGAPPPTVRRNRRGCNAVTLCRCARVLCRGQASTERSIGAGDMCRPPNQTKRGVDYATLLHTRHGQPPVSCHRTFLCFRARPLFVRGHLE